MTDEQEPVEGQEEEVQQTESQIRIAKYEMFVVKPESVDPLWNSEDPCAMAQDLLQEYLEIKSAADGKNYQEYD